MTIKETIKKLLSNITFFKHRFIRNHLNYSSVKKFSESDLIIYFFKFFSNSKVMVDVGAHYGESFDFYESNNWKVYAFEPDKANRQLIHPKFSSTQVYEEAITDVDGEELTLYTSDESTGISSLAAFHPTHKASVTVKTKTLRTFCNEKSIRNIDFLKIDTEGFDLFVLKGFPFEKINPMVIVCEFEDSKTIPLLYTYGDMGMYLKSKGYDIHLSEWHPIVKYGIEHQWKQIVDFPENKLDNVSGWGNFIAIRSDLAASFNFVKGAYLTALQKTER